MGSVRQVGRVRRRGLPLFAWLVGAAASPCAAQVEVAQGERAQREAKQASPGDAAHAEAPFPGHVITVRPSGPEARAREIAAIQERLERRLRRNEEALRSICVGCGSRDAAGGVLFSPTEALRARVGDPSQVLVRRPLPDEVIVEMRDVSPPAGERGSEVTIGPAPDVLPAAPGGVNAARP